jgi:nitroreductase
VIRAQRACRTFAPDDVNDATVLEVLRAATFAPSAENRQPWEFIVVRDAHTRVVIGDITARAWAGGGRAYSESRLAPSLLADVDAGATGGIAAAPVLIVVCGDRARGNANVMPASIFPAAQNLMLAAGALGLGSALTTMPTAMRDELSELLGLPDHVIPMAVIPLGRPARPLGPPRRNPVEQHTHHDRYTMD